MMDVQDLSAQELAALLHFYADAGVDYLLEEEAVDSIAEFEVQKAQRQSGRKDVRETTRAQRQVPSAPAMRPSAPLPVPDDEAVAAARAAAAAAEDLAGLYEAVAGFEACNLKNSARNPVFPKTAADTGILILGPMPSSDDDREGSAFAGRYGELLERMLAAINIGMQDVTLAHCIPWRPPGDRPPTQAEMEICRPFAERLIMLSQARIIMLMGNISVRFFLGNGATVHSVRGTWQNLSVNGQDIPALPMLHPQDLILAPASKRLAWSDLLSFEAALKR
ncbi:uracil-DNA glycosylase [Rhizobium sp. L1K21]|uniref:uracil-DNA glycosylase n=1 Tax=Rhizobium sp. L1K21 TaxID=2954933 RepID=UPI00209305A3|nr:uracil-DNA glycosylase [Rhizobium sp. L1K21]MCO6186659.1 uracil-DNA glycosylase [Rhizobium sp. L1K21]